MNRNQAMEWVKNNYELKRQDETAGAYRFEQYRSKLLKKLGYNRYYTRRLANGVDLVIAASDPSIMDYFV